MYESNVMIFYIIGFSTFFKKGCNFLDPKQIFIQCGYVPFLLLYSSITCSVPQGPMQGDILGRIGQGGTRAKLISATNIS